MSTRLAEIGKPMFSNTSRNGLMSNQPVGIGEIKYSKTPEEILKVLALGSCVALIFYAPRIKTVGIAHVALPDSSFGGVKKDLPGYFADTAIKNLHLYFTKLGVANSRDLIIKMVGGASIMSNGNDSLNIGNRNIMAIRKFLWQNRMGPRKEDVGGIYSRSVHVYAASGEVMIKSPGKSSFTI